MELLFVRLECREAYVAVIQRHFHCASGEWVRAVLSCQAFVAWIKLVSKREGDCGNALFGAAVGEGFAGVVLVLAVS